MTQCGWIRLCTNFAMGTTINNCWEIFCYRVKRDHYDKFIITRELLERIDVYCFNNTLKTDTWTSENNITYLDEIDNEGTVSTFQSLNYSSSSPRNSEIRTISDIKIATDPTTAIGHTASKEVKLEGGRYNRADRGYYNRRLPNGKICLTRSLWYCHDCSVRFRRRNYY